MFNIMTLERNSPIPLYRQLHDILRGRIEEGQFQADEALPTENQLATMFNVSRVTTRKALELLANTDLIIRQPGKGTFIRTEKIEENQQSLQGFAELMLVQHPNLVMKVLGFEMMPVPQKLLSTFDSTENDQVLRVKRIHLVDGVPIAVAIIFLPFDLGKSLTVDQISTTPIYTLLTRQEGITIDRATQRISAISADQEMSELLNIPQDFPVLVVKRVTYSSKGRPLEYIELYYPGKQHELVVELRRTPPM
jgi:GntR family transcriptional regulator